MRFITLTWIFFVCYWKCAAAGVKQENPQPNIIVILVDDLDYVLGGLVRLFSFPFFSISSTWPRVSVDSVDLEKALKKDIMSFESGLRVY